MKQEKQKKTSSFNAFTIIGETFDALRKKSLKAILGSAFLLAILVVFYSVFAGVSGSYVCGIIVCAFVLGVMYVPYTNFVLNVSEGRGSLEDMFNKEHYSLSSILIGILFMALAFFGLVLLVIPAFVFLTLFVLALPIAVNTTGKCFDAFIKAKELSKGFRGRILSIILIFTLVLVVLIALGVGLSYLIFSLWLKLPLWWVVGLVIGVISYAIFVMPYNTLAIIYLYDRVIAEKQEIREKYTNYAVVEEEKIEALPETKHAEETLFDDINTENK